MAVRKRGSTWQIDYIDPAGKRIRKSFKKKKDADAELGKRVSLIAEGRYLDVKKDCKTTMGELLDRYEENFKDQRSFFSWKSLCVKKFKEYFGEKSLLSQIRFVDIETYRNRLRQTPVRGKAQKVRSVASVNREMAVMHHVFQKGVEWEMIEKSPFERGKGIFSKENNTRTRYLTHEEISRLLSSSPDHLKDIIVCAVHTGMRKSEILSLKWSQIKGGFIYLTRTKTDESRQVPVSDELKKLFDDVRRKQGGKSDYVFRYERPSKKEEGHKVVKLVVDNNPILDVKHSFTSAVKKAGIEDFRFHDLRHTCASHLVMNGASLKDVQEILGHKDMTMTLRYAHLSQEHKKKAVNLLNGLTASVSQNVTNAAFDLP
jgi:integrase